VILWLVSKTSRRFPPSAPPRLRRQPARRCPAACASRQAAPRERIRRTPSPDSWGGRRKDGKYWVIQSGDRAGFALEPVAEVGLRELDGDHAVNSLIARLPNLAHPTGAERREQFVGSDPQTGMRRCHSWLTNSTPNEPVASERSLLASVTPDFELDVTHYRCSELCRPLDENLAKRCSASSKTRAASSYLPSRRASRITRHLQVGRSTSS
jgi:hypothetical protein